MLPSISRVGSSPFSRCVEALVAQRDEEEEEGRGREQVAAEEEENDDEEEKLPLRSPLRSHHLPIRSPV